MATGAKFRTAGKNLLSNPAIHQLAESLLAAGVIALPQAAMGEADLDLALGVLGGLAVAAPGSIIAARAGKLGGRQIDKYFHGEPGRIDRVPQQVRDGYNAGMALIPGSRQFKFLSDEMVSNNPDSMNNPVWANSKSLSDTRYHAEGRRADGSVMDPYLNGAEHDLGTLGRRYGDNVAQLITQLAIANSLDGEDAYTENSQ